MEVSPNSPTPIPSSVVRCGILIRIARIGQGHIDPRITPVLVSAVCGHDTDWVAGGNSFVLVELARIVYRMYPPVGDLRIRRMPSYTPSSAPWRRNPDPLHRHFGLVYTVISTRRGCCPQPADYVCDRPCRNPNHHRCLRCSTRCEGPWFRTVARADSLPFPRCGLCRTQFPGVVQEMAQMEQAGRSPAGRQV